MQRSVAMSHLYKEWQDLMREFIKEQPPLHDSYWQERMRLNKEYALNQSSTPVEQTNEENDNG
jgi:hypothetical protein